jgi:hypothetical protein
MDYDFTVIHKPGTDNMADYLSRNPASWYGDSKTDRQVTLAEQAINFVAASSAPSAIKMDVLVEASKRDDLLQRLTKAIRAGRRDRSKEMEPYMANSHEFSVTENGLVLRGPCVVIPAALQLQVLRLAHEGHQGVVKTTKLLRERVWFPRMSIAVKEMVEDCPQCQLSSRGNSPQPLQMTKMPSEPWSKLSLDFYGPLANGHYLLVTNDESTRFPVVDEVATTSAKCTIESLDKTFSEFGIPDEIKTDNGPPFTSHEFAEFCERHGIKHRRITPLHPQANGQSENFMRNINKIVRNSFHSGYNSRLELNAFLRHTHQRTLRQPICCSSDQTIAVCQNVRQSANPSKK